jgi:ribose-phosphate pyrophosphokinase
VRVVVAPDSFKGSIGAQAAAAAIAEGWHGARPGDDLVSLPLADGGEGTLQVLAATCPAARWHPVEVTGPDGQAVASRWLEFPGGTGYIELAQASGLPLMAALDPLGAQTVGTGQLIAGAVDAGLSRIVVALGGSASTDGGAGALTALGARFLDSAGRELPGGGGALRDLASADLTGLRPPPPGGVTCLTDVRAPLLGPGGAAAVFGPQKGADAAQVAMLEAGLTRLALVLGGDPDAPGAGAAGGTGYGFAAAWGARLTPGAAEICRATGLDDQLSRADLVLTGEGRYDATSGNGKITGAVLAAAARAGVPAALVGGDIAADPPPGVVAVALAGLAGDAAAAMASPERWLRVAGRMLATDLGQGGSGARGGDERGWSGRGELPRRGHRSLGSVREIAIFSGSAHRGLAEEICAQLGVPLLPSRLSRFANDCLEVQLQSNCRERDVFLIQPLCPPVQDHLVELLLMLDAARGASAARATAVIPYYAYARSDKKTMPRVSIGGRLVADLLVTAGASRVLTMTLHAPQVHGFFSVPVDHLHALREIAAHFLGQDLTGTVVVSPDLGNAKQASVLARMLGLPVAAGAKERHSDSSVTISSIIGDVAGRDAIVLDDEISRGTTIIELLARLREHGARSVRIACTHGLFADGALKRIAAQPEVTEIVCGNTVPIGESERDPKLHVISLAPALAEAIRRIHVGESVSALFGTSA